MKGVDLSSLVYLHKLDLLVDKYIVLNNEYYEIHVEQAKANILSYRQRPEKE